MKNTIDMNEGTKSKAVVYVSDNIKVRSHLDLLSQDKEEAGDDDVVIYVGGNISVRRADSNG